MGDVVADAMLDRVKGQGVTIALQNGGGLRASIGGGTVTMGDVLAVLPFQNTLSTFNLTGAAIVAALENGVSQVEDGAGRFPQVPGLRFSWDPKVAPMQGRIKSVEVKDGDGWVPIDPAKVYAVVSNDFMRKGGDGYVTLRDDATNAYDFGPGLEGVLADWLAANGDALPTVGDGSPGSSESAAVQVAEGVRAAEAGPDVLVGDGLAAEPVDVARGHEGRGRVADRRLGGDPAERLDRPAVDRPRRRRGHRAEDRAERVRPAQGVGRRRPGAGERQTGQCRGQRSPKSHPTPPVPATIWRFCPDDPSPIHARGSRFSPPGGLGNL